MRRKRQIKNTEGQLKYLLVFKDDSDKDYTDNNAEKKAEEDILDHQCSEQREDMAESKKESGEGSNDTKTTAASSSDEGSNQQNSSATI